eukprot:s2903_g3.t1
MFELWVNYAFSLVCAQRFQEGADMLEGCVTGALDCGWLQWLQEVFFAYFGIGLLTIELTDRRLKALFRMRLAPDDACTSLILSPAATSTDIYRCSCGRFVSSGRHIRTHFRNTVIFPAAGAEKDQRNPSLS